MYDTSGVAKFHSVHQAFHNRIDFLLRKIPFLTQSVLKTSTCHVLENHVEFVCVFFQVVKFNDVGMVEFFQYSYLVNQISDIVGSETFPG